MLPGYADISAISEDCSNKLPAKGRVSHDMLHPCNIVIGEDHSHFISGHAKFEETNLSAVSQSNLGALLLCVRVCVCVGRCVCVCVCGRVCGHGFIS